MTLYLKEMKRNLKPFLIWTAVISSFILLIAAIYESIAGDPKMLESIITVIPEPMAKMFGMDLGAWTTVLGVYSTYFSFYVLLMVSMYAIMLGMNILGKEEREKTGEFLLTRPITRTYVVLSKMGVMYTYIFLINLITSIFGFAMLNAFTTKVVPAGDYFTLCLYGLLLNSFFAGIGILISIFVKRGRSSLGAGIGIVAGTYALNMMANAIDKLSFLKYLTPFTLADTNVAQAGYGPEALSILLLIIIPAACCTTTLLIYRKKDILI